jgi:hypothetical protein
MLLERLTFLINPLTRQIVALVVRVTMIDNKLIQFLHNSFKYCHLWTIVYVVQRGYCPLNNTKKTILDCNFACIMFDATKFAWVIALAKRTPKLLVKPETKLNNPPQHIELSTL